MKIIVIIVTYNAVRWIDRCLTSLQKSAVQVDCLIVDNKSQDETVKIIKKNYPSCKLVEVGRNLGFGKANNIGLQYAIENDYDYVYLLNQDAWIFPETISSLIKIHVHHPEYGILSPLQMNSELSKLDKNFLLCCGKEMLSDCICGNMKEIYDTNFVMAAHWLITKDALLKVGGFSPSFPHYGEDHNYIHRLLFYKFKVGIVPQAKAVHDREFRVESSSLKMRKAYLKSIAEMSNPFNGFYSSLILQPLKLIKRCVNLKQYGGIKHLFVLFRKIPAILKNRKISMSVEAAFLK